MAHRPFLWSNNASGTAVVSCVIVGLSKSADRRRLFEEDHETEVKNINPYLLDAPNITVRGVARPIFDLPKMDVGALARDDGALILSREEANTLRDEHPEADRFLRHYVGAKELINGSPRFCLWIPDADADSAWTIPEIARRLELVRAFRARSDAQVTRDSAKKPHRFGQITGHGVPVKQSIMVPRTSSERRPYLPVDLLGPTYVPSADCQVLFDAPPWCFSLLASRLHLTWVLTITGRLEGRIRYSSTLCWHAFPVPKFTEDQLTALTKSAMAILRCRLTHHPKTIADLYDPDEMPEDLRAAHQANDDLLESMYIGRPFRNDTERLEHLFKLYAARVKKLKKGAAT